MKHKYYDVNDLMEIYKVKKRDTILKKIHSGEIEAIKTGNRYLIHESALKNYHKANLVVPAPPRL